MLVPKDALWQSAALVNVPLSLVHVHSKVPGPTLYDGGAAEEVEASAGVR
jgi:hypothetical protein